MYVLVIRTYLHMVRGMSVYSLAVPVYLIEYIMPPRADFSDMDVAINADDFTKLLINFNDSCKLIKMK